MSESKPNKKTPSTAVITDADVDEYTAPTIAKLVFSLLTGATEHGPFEPAQILILCRTNTAVERVIEELEKLGIKTFWRGNSQSQTDIVEAIPDYLRVLASSPPKQKPLANVLKTFYGIHSDNLKEDMMSHFGVTFSADLWDALQNMDAQERQKFGEKFGVSETIVDIALHDIISLRNQCENRSLWGAYTKMSERISLDEYLTEADRQNLATFESVLEDVEDEFEYTVLDDRPVYGSETIIDYLENATEKEDTCAAPEQPSDAVGVGTVHNSKGDEADCVILTSVTDDETVFRGEDEANDLARLSYGLTENTGDLGDVSFERRAQDNARNLLYVGVSRARELFVAVGDDSASATPRIEGELPETVLESLPVQDRVSTQQPWSELLAAMPEDTLNWNTVVQDVPTARYTLNGESVTNAAEEFQRLESAATTDYTSDLQSSLKSSEIDDQGLPRRYSYSALKDAVKCGRAYLLRHVYGVSQSSRGTSDESAGVNHRVAGDLFHFTAERCLGTTNPDEWFEVLDRLARNRGLLDSPTYESAKEYVNRFLDTEVVEWEVYQTEVKVSVQVEDVVVDGWIDALVKHPNRDGELLALDFKTGNPKWTETTQLQIYVAGANQTIKEFPVTEGAFVQLGDSSGTLDSRVDLRATNSGMADFRDTINNWVSAAQKATLDGCDNPGNCGVCSKFGFEAEGDKQ